jgi:uncharacterized protein
MRTLLLTLLIPLFAFAAEPEIACGGRAVHGRGEIPLDAPWKKTVQEFTAKNLQHSAWGLAHSKRDYLLALELAAQDSVSIDCDVLFAAAFLHDMGGFAPYAKTGVDHALRSTEVLEGILEPAGFPVSKIAAVKSAVLTHSYYERAAPATAEAIVLHDADTLDFLGAISVARIFSLTDREMPNLVKGFGLLETLLKQAPPALVGGAYTKALGAKRQKEMQELLATLKLETYGLTAF